MPNDRNRNIRRLYFGQRLGPTATADQLGLTIDQVYGVVRRAKRAGMTRDNWEETEAVLKPNIFGTGMESSEKAATTPQQEVRVEDNTMTITARAVPQISNLDDLLKFFKVDLSEWTVTRHVVNFWGNENYPCTQVKAWLERTVAEPVELAFTPVQIRVTPQRPPQPRQRGPQLAVGLFDAHIGYDRDLVTGALKPFHDRRALSAAVEMCGDTQPLVIVLGGDWLDNTEWTDKFLRSPEVHLTTQPMIFEAAWWIGQLRAVCPDADIVYIEGNHELRMRRMVMAHLPYMYRVEPARHVTNSGKFDLPSLLGLDELNVEYVEGYPGARYNLVAPQVVFEHGNTVKQGSGASVTAVVRDTMYSRVFGHIHRLELATRTLRLAKGERTVYAASGGCLCHTDGRVPGSDPENNWQQGLAVLEMSDPPSLPILVPIERGAMMFNGTAYAGDWEKTVRDNLSKDTDYPF